jgi:hypothetical protein
MYVPWLTFHSAGAAHEHRPQSGQTSDRERWMQSHQWELDTSN